MKSHGTTRGANPGSGKAVLSRRSSGRKGDFFEDEPAKVLPPVSVNPATELPKSEAEVADAFRDTIRGSVYELYQRRGWEPEGD